MRKLKDRSKKLLIGLAIAFAVYSLAGFFLLPYAIKSILVKKLSENLHREASIESVSLNPYSFLIVIRGFKLKDRNTPETFVSFDELRVNLQGRSFLKRGLTVKELTLAKPYVNVTHNQDLSYNFSDLIPKGGTKAVEEKAPAPPLKFSFNNIRIINGSVDFNDLPKKKKHTVREMTANIPFISSIPSEVEIFVEPSFSAKVNDTLFDFKGDSKPFSDSLETSLNIDLKDFFLPTYVDYSPVPLNFKMPSGTLSAHLTLSYIRYRDKPPTLTLKGSTGFKDLDFRDTLGAPLMTLPALNAEIAYVEVFSRKARLSSLLFIRPKVSLVRERSGAINLMSLLPGGKEVKPEPEKEKKETGPAFTFDIDKIELKQARLDFSDLTRPHPFNRTLEPVNCGVQNFTNSPGKPARLSLDFKNLSGESVAASGDISINPVMADLKLEAKGIDIRPLQSYIDDVVKLTITKGRASASGEFAVKREAKGLEISYRGNAVLSGFSTIDRLNRDEFLKWDSLALNGLEFGYSPVRLAVKSIVLSNFYSNMVINKDGSLNLRDAVAAAPAAPSKPAAPAKTEGAPPNVRIESITLKGGRIDFRDRRMEPVYSVSIQDLGGRVSGLYLNGSKTAEIDLAGKIDKYAPLSISGAVNPVKKDLFLDMRFVLKDFDLSTLTPYSGRYIGYKIEKGKIFLDLKYFIEKKKLDAKNGVLIDQITLGDHVESPQATKLPVKFALSLLKDRNGEIKLNMPLSGTTDSPDFSISGIIIQMIFNLLEKAATAPFALLGDIFGGGPELGYVEFAPGSHSITADNTKKLDTLITALYDRPNLKLDIEGYVSGDDDRTSLVDYKLMKAVKTQKLNELIKAGQKAVPADEVVLEQGEYEKYLWLAYKNAEFPKEKNFLGFTKKLPAPQMEKVLREHTTVTEEDLKDLASRRSNTVKDYILKSGKVEPSRVFIVWPASLTPGKKANVKESRVEFKLE